MNWQQIDFSMMCKQIRKKQKMTLPAMAAMLDVKLNTYKCWEAGTREPNGQQAIRLLMLYMQSAIFNFKLIGLPVKKD